MIKTRFIITGKKRVLINGQIGQTINFSQLSDKDEILNEGVSITIKDRNIYEKYIFGSMVDVVIESPDKTVQYATSSIRG